MRTSRVAGPPSEMGNEIATCYAGGENAIENARLIAAAPELLEALKGTLNYWKSTGFAECEPDCDCLVESVRAAIAKAVGR